MFKSFSKVDLPFFIGAILTGLLISIFAIAPQINLWMECKENCNGIYAISDLDEPFYAAYLVALMDGKTRRNSPYSGAVDTENTPQKESALSIQLLASYPIVFFGKLFDLSITNIMILISWLIGFLAAVCIYWLIYLFTKDNISAFVGTLIVLFIGTTFGGQGTTFSLFSSHEIHFFHSLVFLRRYVPALSFPALFLFIIFVWKFFSSELHRPKLKALILALLSFIYCVYSYYYFWTTAFAWFFCLIGFLAIFRFELLKENIKYLAGLAISMTISLIPYFLLVSNRETSVDSVILINKTRELDLWRTPEIISYIATALIFVFAKFKIFNLKDIKIIFLLAINLVTIVVFNHQLITGRSVQPYHYEAFSVNYLVTFSLFCLIFLFLQQKIQSDRFKLIILSLAVFPICIGTFDTLYGNSLMTATNVQRDKLVPALNKIKNVSATKEFKSQNPESVVLSYDISEGSYLNSIEIPALTSQPILWGIHLNLLPDIDRKENAERLNTFLYYQNISKNELVEYISNRSVWAVLGYFGPEKTSHIYTGKSNAILPSEVAEITENYEKFVNNFSSADTEKVKISFVLVNKNVSNDFTNLDRWYERDAGETLGDYIVYQVKLRQK